VIWNGSMFVFQARVNFFCLQLEHIWGFVYIMLGFKSWSYYCILDLNNKFFAWDLNRYLRVGNGNQLVRDPKTISHALASEKVRWSLQTTRCRLAKKQHYFQFFTRFGKCNKEGGKCPYIHDWEKVDIYTKFLKGICSNVDCELNHKV